MDEFGLNYKVIWLFIIGKPFSLPLKILNKHLYFTKIIITIVILISKFNFKVELQYLKI